MSTLLERPDTIFEANFFNTTDGQSWTNLSDYVELQEGISISKRRQLIFDEVSAGTLALYLNNSDGTFNNDRSDLDFFGLIKVDVPVRFRARWPRVPADTVNMLTDDQSTADSTDVFVAEQGDLDLETSDVPTGQTTALIWNTGVLAGTDNRVLTGDFNSRSADSDLPMYVEASTEYTGTVQVKCDTSGTGISFQVSARILWYDDEGALISESTGTAKTLTTSYQQVKVTATSPATAYTARLAIANETAVAPASAAIAVTGFTGDRVNRGGKLTHLKIQPETNVGDVAIVWLYAGAQPTFSAPDDSWTFLDSWTDDRGKTSVWWKILTQDDIGTTTEWSINQTGKHWLSMMVSYSGADQTTPINAHATDTESTFQTGHSTPSVTSTVSNCWLVSAVFDTSSTTSTWTAPAGETVRQQEFCNGGNAATGIITDNATAVASGSHSGGSFSSNVKSKFASMSRYAIAPATGTGPGSVEVWMGAWQFEKGSSASTWAEGGHWKDLFTGLTDSWTKTWTGELSLMEVQATDRSKQLNNINIGSAISETILAAAPIAYYMLNESGDVSTTEAANSAATVQDTMKLFQVGTGGTLEWGSGVGPPIDAEAAVVITKSSINNGPSLKTTLTNPIVGSSAITLMTWFNSSDSDTSSTLTLAKVSPTNEGATEFAYAELRGTSGTNFQANTLLASEAASVQVTVTKATDYFDGKTHFACATFVVDGGELIATLYIDGEQVATNSSAVTYTAFPTMTTLSVGSSFPTKHLCSGTYSHTALFDFEVDADTIADIYTAGTTAFAGDTVDQRIGRIADWANLVNLNLESSGTLCDRHMPDQQSALSAIQQAARTDGGTSFIDDDGSITFKTRSDKEGTITTWLTLDTRRIDPSMAEVTDDQLLVNQAVVKRLGANTTATTNALDSQTEHGIYSKEVDTIQQDADDAHYNGEYLTAFYSEPSQRCDSVMFNAQFLDDWATILTQDMWNVIHITNLPSIEESTTLDLYVEGWQYQIDDESWVITYDTSAAIPFAVLNDSTRGVAGDVVVAW